MAHAPHTATASPRPSPFEHNGSVGFRSRLEAGVESTAPAAGQDRVRWATVGQAPLMIVWCSWSGDRAIDHKKKSSAGAPDEPGGVQRSEAPTGSPPLAPLLAVSNDTLKRKRSKKEPVVLRFQHKTPTGDLEIAGLGRSRGRPTQNAMGNGWARPEGSERGEAPPGSPPSIPFLSVAKDI